MIKDVLKSLKKNQFVVINSPLIDSKITGIVYAKVSKGGHVTVNYSDGLVINRKLPEKLLCLESLSYSQIHSFLNGEN